MLEQANDQIIIDWDSGIFFIEIEVVHFTFPWAVIVVIEISLAFYQIPLEAIYCSSHTQK